MITSVHNPKIKWVRTLQSDSQVRHEDNAFVVEGIRLVEEALTSGWKAQWLIHTEKISPRALKLVEYFATQGVPVESVTDQVMRSTSDTQTPQGILAVLSQQLLPIPAHLDFIFIPDSVRDPGNLGTMLRTASSAGAQAVLVPPGTVDPYSPKVVRSAMGAHFRLPIHLVDWDSISQTIKLNGLHVYLADADGELAHTQADFHTPSALIVGGEAEGAGQKARELAETSVYIDMPGGGESLNAAIAAAILLFEIVRQRSN